VRDKADRRDLPVSGSRWRTCGRKGYRANWAGRAGTGRFGPGCAAGWKGYAGAYVRVRAGWAGWVVRFRLGLS
jgi:hypothetical protein